jgi:hypothetical protein
MTRLLCIGFLVAAFAACDDPAPTQPPAPATPPAEKPTAMTDAAIDAADIPVEEDFEEQAAAEITAETLDVVVAKLDTEIQADEP